jgi:hypothetical protein
MIGDIVADREAHYYIFSRSGFTAGLKKEAERIGRLTPVGPRTSSEQMPSGDVKQVFSPQHELKSNYYTEYPFITAGRCGCIVKIAAISWMTARRSAISAVQGQARRAGGSRTKCGSKKKAQA